MLPTLIFGLFYAILAYISSGQIYSQQRLLWFIYIIILSILCTQGLGHLIGIIFNKNNVIAVEIVIGITLFLIMFCNLFLPIKEMSEFFQILT
jgi:ABC-type multidrug transport system permease subunit